MFCTNCGKQIEDNAVFCPACGAHLGDQTPPEQATPAAAEKPARPKRKLSRRAVIAIIAAAALVVEAIVLLTVKEVQRRNDPAAKLVGTWVCNEEYDGEILWINESVGDIESIARAKSQMPGSRSYQEWLQTYTDMLDELKDPKYKLTFRQSGAGAFGGSAVEFAEYVDPTIHFSLSYTVEEDNTLDLHVLYNRGEQNYRGGSILYRYTYSKDAMDGDEHCWYIKGDTLYLGGVELERKD